MAISNKFIQRIEKVKLAGESYKNSNIYKNKKDEIQKVFLPSFSDVYVKFNKLCNDYESLKAICDTNIEIELLKDNIRVLINKISQEEYDKNSVMILKRNIDGAYNELSLKWKEYIREKTAAITEILNTLDKFIANMPEKTQLNNKKFVFTTAKIGAPNAITAIEEYIKLYNELMNKLNLKDSVLEFLKLLSTGNNVTLKDLDEDVYNWIKGSDFATRINLKIS